MKCPICKLFLWLGFQNIAFAVSKKLVESAEDIFCVMRKRRIYLDG